jgi:hypothetical protein
MEEHIFVFKSRQATRGVAKIYNAASSLVRFENNNFLIIWGNDLAFHNARVVCSMIVFLNIEEHISYFKTH